MKNAIGRRVRYLTRGIGRWYLALCTVGLVGAAVTGVGVVTARVGIQAFGFIVAFGALIVMVGYERLDRRRQPTPHQRSARAPRPVAQPATAGDTHRGLSDHIATQRVVLAELRREMELLQVAVESTVEESARSAIAEQAALFQLLLPSPSVRGIPLPAHVLPTHLTGLRETVRSSTADRTLVVGLGAAALLVAPTGDPDLPALVVVETNDDPDDRQAAARLARLADTCSQPRPRIELIDAPWNIPDTPRAFHSWYDLGVLDGRSFDLIVVVVPSGTRAQPLLPLLPTLAERLESGGHVRVLESRRRPLVVEAWRSELGWNATEHPDGTTSFSRTTEPA
ncbi:hypothetical protein GCG21_11970 [Pseudactinotalea sp. HY160]|uniref:hypothetical protein n=1 Tax=Pseudactinotalea sp. HY160 TaxID=2654490 RepID=UPI00128B17B7|nr:hypothetical protein [Pseudactinotalea sp. HY160]MPV50709.1 hypothetical protein [Pseudactinotalea sp. HY160]